MSMNATMKSGVCIDLGASSTRITGQDINIYELPNGLVFIDRDEVVDLESTGVETHSVDTWLNNLDLMINKTAGEPNKAFPARALIGNLANRYSDSLLRPSVLMNKSRQPINSFNIIVACAEMAYLYGYDGTPLTLYLALPPLEVSSMTKDEINAQLVGSYNVASERLRWTTTINIKEVRIFAECYMSLAAFFFDFPSCTPNKEHFEKYGKGYMLGIDIGASTTDFYICENGKPIEKSGQTIKTGCNVIEMDIANGIRSRFGFDPTHDNLTTVIREGRLPMGRGYKEVGDILVKAKRKFASNIVAELQNYFRLVNIPLQNIGGIVASGGGSLKSGYLNESNEYITTCECTSEYITKELANITENIDVIAMEDPRTANVRGLFIKMMMDKAMEARKAQAAAQQAASAAQAQAEQAQMEAQRAAQAVEQIATSNAQATTPDSTIAIMATQAT